MSLCHRTFAAHPWRGLSSVSPYARMLLDGGSSLRHSHRHEGTRATRQSASQIRPRLSQPRGDGRAVPHRPRRRPPPDPVRRDRPLAALNVAADELRGASVPRPAAVRALPGWAARPKRCPARPAGAAAGPPAGAAAGRPAASERRLFPRRGRPEGPVPPERPRPGRPLPPLPDRDPAADRSAGAAGRTYAAGSPTSAVTAGASAVTATGVTEIAALRSTWARSRRCAGRDKVTTSPPLPARAVRPERCR